MSKKDQSQKHSWKRRVKDWMIVPHSNVSDPHDVSVEELAKHHTRTDCWMAIDGVVYDVSRFVPFHPGGTRVLEMYAGRDATAPFQRSHMTSAVLECISSCRVGRLVLPSGGTPQGQPPQELSSVYSSNTPPASSTPPMHSADLSINRGVQSRPLEILESTVTTVVSSSQAPQIPAASDLSDDTNGVTATNINTEIDSEAEARSWADMTIQQLTSVAMKSRLFPGVGPETLTTAVSEAVSQCVEGDIQEEEALRELFVALDSDGKGYITRAVLRDFFYRLDNTGASEEALLRAPEQITALDFFRLFRQL